MRSPQLMFIDLRETYDSMQFAESRGVRFLHTFGRRHGSGLTALMNSTVLPIPHVQGEGPVCHNRDVEDGVSGSTFLLSMWRIVWVGYMPASAALLISGASCPGCPSLALPWFGSRCFTFFCLYGLCIARNSIAWLRCDAYATFWRVA